MKGREFKAAITVLMATIMTGAIITGCGSMSSNIVASAEEISVDKNTNSVVTTARSQDDVLGAPYFEKRVYANYAQGSNSPKHYFYVFNDKDYGYTADGDAQGIGVPFDIVQRDGVVKFYFGGEGELEEDFIVTKDDNGVIYGYFEDVSDLELVFEPVEGVTPDTFNAENYVNGPENSIYRDANGWSIKYDATRFDVDKDDDKVTFVYMGESAGTNMITATYIADKKAADAVKVLGKAYGKDASYSEAPFINGDDVTGYWVSTTPDTEGSGAYMTAVARDYRGGALLFELNGHMGNDEDNNMEVSDALAEVLDSLEFI